jgi:hypothetical protein
MRVPLYLAAVLLIIAGVAYQFQDGLLTLYNARFLDGYTQKVAAHRINSQNRFDDLNGYGIRRFEIDLIWNGNDGQFDVCHDLEDCNTLTLTALLSQSVDSEFIWLDLKNLSEENVHPVLSAFEEIDHRFAIKDRSLIESTSLSIALGVLTQAGFNTSYYLPTEKISGNYPVELAGEIQQHLRHNSIPNISFDCRGYPFVTKELMPLLDPGIQFHVWNTRHSYQDWGLLDSLQGDPCISDPKTKTALISFFP